MKRLLIIACSQRKRTDTADLPAIERYDGPAFRVLRKYLSEASGDVPIVLILSAKYGLIDSSRPIRDYDRRMSAARARELRPGVLEAGRPVLTRSWAEVGVCVGRHYRAALGDLLEHAPPGAQVRHIGGGLGPRLTRLRDWLRRAEGKEV
jgi:hypothetical protein